MACEDLLKELEAAERANDLAEKSLASAEAGLASAEWGEPAALAALLGCFFTFEVPPVFILCQAAALAGLEAAQDAIEAAQLAIEVAEAQVDDTQDAEDEARDAYCACLEN